ncbi:MAG: hypothetical protein SFW08_09945 [Gemmatimonadaceae bacterium]|nr:hypothetical protein [Gemmatimonadaceae bacterium]
MPRPAGRRNADFDVTRTTLLTRLADRLRQADGATLSFREMASAAEVSLPTLRHYFGDRAGVLRAVLQFNHLAGEAYLRQIAAAPLAPLRASVRDYLDFLVDGLRAGVGRMLTVGLMNGMQDAEVARACLSELLEPTIRALEVRLERHLSAGDLRPLDVRHGALALISPVVLAVLHQDEMDGRSYRPLDLVKFLDDLAEGFVRAHGAR